MHAQSLPAEGRSVKHSPGPDPDQDPINNLYDADAIRIVQVL